MLVETLAGHEGLDGELASGIDPGRNNGHWGVMPAIWDRLHVWKGWISM